MFFFTRFLYFLIIIFYRLLILASAPPPHPHPPHPTPPPLRFNYRHEQTPAFVWDHCKERGRMDQLRISDGMLIKHLIERDVTSGLLVSMA